MKKGWLLVLLLAVIIIVGVIILFVVPAPTANAPTGGTATTTNTAPNANILSVDNINPGSTIASPLAITGKALNTMYFEASFPIKLKDAGGNVIAQGPAHAASDWTVPGQVPFSITFTFPAQPAGSNGTLVFMNDNPSGDPARQIEVDIPVKF